MSRASHGSGDVGRAKAATRIAGPCAILALLALPAPAPGQVADAWLLATPLDASGRPRSPRTEALGSLSVAVEDEESRVSLYDHTDNPAALLADRDTSSVEQFGDYDRFQDGYYGLDHGALHRWSALRAAVRNPRVWALGVDGTFGDLRASRHDLCPSPDGCRFMRDFNLPVLSALTPVEGDRSFGAKVESPRARMAYARSFRRRLTVGLRVAYSHESEDRRLATPYPVDHTSRSGGITGGALYDLRFGGVDLTAGGFGHYSTDKVVGRSQTPLNDDRYEWWRPQVGFGGHLAVRRGDWIRGVIDGRHRSYDGEEVASVNWAPFFFLNPLPSQNQTTNIFKKKWSAFLSGYRRNEMSTRWMVDLPGTTAHVGASYGYYREYEWIHTNEDVLSAAQDLDVKRLGYEAAGGGAIDFSGGTGLVAAEVHYGRGHRIDFLGELPDIATERLSYHFGAEYRAFPWLPLRGGFVLLRHYPDRRSGIAPIKGARVTAGTGYDWRALGTQLEVAWSHEHLRHAPGDPSEEVAFGDRISIVARHLF